MKAALLGCFWFMVASEAFAHRLDEYLQAARIAVATNRIDLTFELTPGVAVAAKVLERIDPNHDGRISDDEGGAYAQQFLKDLNIGVDGKSVTMNVMSVSLPLVQDVRSGTGGIRIQATLAVGSLGAGSHALTLTNGHLPAISVYLVNALRSNDPAVEIGKQTRDELQRSYRLEFRVRPLAP